MKKLIVLLALAAGSMPALAQDDDGVIVLSDTVTGNQEQPKVLYIVPWQDAEDTSMLNRSVASQLQRDIFAHIERPEHQRELQLRQALAEPESPE